MGGVWREGSTYSGPHGEVWWIRLAHRPANNPVALYLAAFIRDVPLAILAGDDPHTTPPPDPSWAGYGEQRVMAWNGGASDVP